MSLDVYLEELVYECEYCGAKLKHPARESIWVGNITHNLVNMALQAGVYEGIWHPEKRGIEKASQLIDILGEAISHMREKPDIYKKHNPKNAWGDYDGFLNFLVDYYHECREHPDAKIKVHL